MLQGEVKPSCLELLGEAVSDLAAAREEHGVVVVREQVVK
eukprot:CAMPEP_0185171456 /NCGR_PEP_ID=MMETSP1139-20130426/20231_1 /TAXON_ID=298111 /ORGANISM="Pavlova sp., Strain CCMP459" /LENGTH=39 /DNA_ID= /DNA_START= /DNA_END= /DNA_ORIENTATION=